MTVFALCTLALLLALALFRAPIFVWTAALGVIGATWATVLGFSAAANTVLFAAFVALAATCNVPMLRRRLFSDPVLALYRRILPDMSQTEKEAIDAGTVWWDADLFSGRPDWERLLHTPAPRLNAEEQAFLDGPVEEACAMANDWEITHERQDLPPQLWQYLKDKGFFGMIIPKKYGGLGFSALGHSAVVMKLSSRSNALAVTVMVPNSLGPAELLLHYGTEEQKNHYLPRLARGLEIPCFALTSPEAGSDAASIPDFGVVCKGTWQGRETLGMRLTWDKRYITLGPVASLLGTLLFLVRHEPHATEHHTSLLAALRAVGDRLHERAGEQAQDKLLVPDELEAALLRADGRPRPDPAAGARPLRAGRARPRGRVPLVGHHHADLHPRARRAAVRHPLPGDRGRGSRLRPRAGSGGAVHLRVHHADGAPPPGGLAAPRQPVRQARPPPAPLQPARLRGRPPPAPPRRPCASRLERARPALGRAAPCPRGGPARGGGVRVPRRRRRGRRGQSRPRRRARDVRLGPEGLPPVR